MLVGGGELLVRGATSIAADMRVSPLVIGLTVVAFGTSAPELGVSLQAAFGGAADVAVGNVIGSNIFNVLLILGLAALVTPLSVASQLIRRDTPLMLAVSVLAFILASDGQIGRGDGLILFATLIVYVVLCVKNARRESVAVQQQFAQEFSSPVVDRPRWVTNVVLVAGGLAMLAGGSKCLVDGAVAVALALGVSEFIIGVTIVAAGTSLPEVVTSIVASYRGEKDVAIGNVVGSNLFNLGCVLGGAACVSPAPIPVAASAIRFDFPVMILVAAACVPFFWTGKRVSRGEGMFLVAGYAVYVDWLILGTPS
ncbi:Inner membrane protein YrbG [Crateriforma conspicua]|uniref:Inner membrane protein YrbG n=1 Tax=Crateriforma conspicua TaxID=2527996 RepID=A0A5C6FNI1_9PLAN|nr:Inner membrane protein YrbG [Crateriforma conspicua]